MQWIPSNRQEQQRLERAFSNRGIPFNVPGFYDHPSFLEAERADPRFLELYARYVEVKSYSDVYLEEAGKRVTAAAIAIEAAVASDGRQGACVDASGMLGRMLDRLGVWSYVAKSTLTVMFPPNYGMPPRYFWAVDMGDFVAPHAVVVAPPFGVVDVTVRHQQYDKDQEALLPTLILADQWTAERWAPEDLVNTEILDALVAKRMPLIPFLNSRYGPMMDVLQRFPVRIVAANGTHMKYVTTGIGGTIEPLEEVTGYQPNGRTALQIFEQDLQPQFPTTISG